MDKTAIKRQIRKEIKERIRGLSVEYIKAASGTICSRIISLPEYQNAGTVFCFAGSIGEPDTLAVIEDALSRGKRVGLPLCISDGIMEVREIKNPERDLKAGAFGIAEPAPGTALIEPEEIDFAVLPCVTCDKKGNRLGHGKGYYDRYLARAEFPTCMICFEQLISEEIPMDEFDRKADIVITEA